MIEEEVVIGTCRLLLGDCRAIVPTLDMVHAVITDPPYGLGFTWQKRQAIKRKGTLGSKKPSPDTSTAWDALHGDDSPFDPRPLLHYPQQIFWGGNYYAHLPPATCWLVWDKRCGMRSDTHGDAELAWTNLPGVIRIHRQLWRGVVRAGEENAVNSRKLHPTQKPLALMRWCVDMTTGCVLDPYMGSGTTMVACAERGRPGIGIEIKSRYFRLACERVRQTLAQLDFMRTPPATPDEPRQMSLGMQEAHA